ncbi:FecR domain-containing protein [Aurantibacter crassamenti]|uniref:FecR family protein n=1 Tax=Aurantibacter crassamenti TaxID=1837375 RepID=UPI001939D249|nr:FecR domain-containing protein [Aurantibacter crassamenti]MBM1105755.1 FecR domain-containing protein [Aurantibacter crassamenti]
MKYTHYSEDDFIVDAYFQKWVLRPDNETQNFWDNWISKHPEKKEIIESAAQFIRLLADDDSNELPDEDFDVMWQNIIKKRNGESSKHSQFKIAPGYIKNIVKIAAVFIGIVVIALSVYRYTNFNTHEETSTITNSEIILKLEDGSIQVINETSSEVIKNAQGDKVVAHNKNTLTYEESNLTKRETTAFNELIIPYGKRFELKLSDGSKVILNSGSKLRYPVAFIKGEPRNVYLDGEAYFSVAKNKEQPFTVITDQMNTRVYGTKFNVSSYKNENNTSTVLIEGSVGVYNTNQEHENELKNMKIEPGQRATIENNAIEIDQVNVDKHIAWAQGQLLFINDEFEVITKELERHFNIKIDNQVPQLHNKRFTGTFTKESINQILKVFQEHTSFDFRINGNTITLNEKL